MTVHSLFSTTRADPGAVPRSSPMPLYRENTINACPGCGQSQWFIGRVMAQCACCETALPLAHGWRFAGLREQG